ncbi:hypothetical protein [Roseospira navarrensis]|uniref:Lipoprotein n=1 Tax=Roseospira navarrensis TaxID=140058 RepID=A0A7X1ZGM3_9PROT|nr:hypothetical protein [Roseospira navarrensis]MQX37669.1 hypothetical protein [Roseospira navarrensis]
MPPVPTRPRSALCAAALLALLSACASDDGAGWVKGGVTPSQRAADSSACKREADEHALRRTHQPDRLDLGGRDALGADPMAQVDRSEARDAFRRYYTACMQARGYTRQGR